MGNLKGRRVLTDVLCKKRKNPLEYYLEHFFRWYSMFWPMLTFSDRTVERRRGSAVVRYFPFMWLHNHGNTIDMLPIHYEGPEK